jgi:hypothetical protein
MFTQLFLVGLTASLVLAGGEISDDIMEELNSWNLFARCYGEENYLNWCVAINNAFKSCQDVAAPPSPALAANEVSQEVVRNVRLAQYPGWPAGVAPAAGAWGNRPWSPFLLPQPAFGGRKKRQVVGAGLLHPTEEEIAAFGAAALNLKLSMPAKVGNLSCVLSKMNMIDAAGNVNLQHFTVEKWNMLGPNGAAKDPAFVAKMQEGYTDCYNIAQAWPQSSLDKNPMSKTWGRQMFFFKCAMKLSTKACAQAQMLEHLEQLYGKMDPATFPELKGDLYEAASYAFNVEREMMSPEKKMIQRFFLKGNVH